MTQEITSAKTSRNQVAKGHKAIDWKPGMINLDFGGGKWDSATDWLFTEHKVINLVYDPYNRSEEHNDEVLSVISYCDTITCHNLLNVIENEFLNTVIKGIAQICYSDRVFSEHIKNLEGVDAKNRTVYISVYEGNRTGKGDTTRDGYQRNEKLSEYISRLSEVFQSVEKKGKLIICK